MLKFTLGMVAGALIILAVIYLMMLAEYFRRNKKR